MKCMSTNGTASPITTWKIHSAWSYAMHFITRIQHGTTSSWNRTNRMGKAAIHLELGIDGSWRWQWMTTYLHRPSSSYRCHHWVLASPSSTWTINIALTWSISNRPTSIQGWHHPFKLYSTSPLYPRHKAWTISMRPCNTANLEIHMCT